MFFCSNNKKGMELQRIDTSLTLTNEKIRNKTREVNKLVAKSRNVQTEDDFKTIAIKVSIFENDIIRLRAEATRLEIEKSNAEMKRTMRRSYLEVAKTQPSSVGDSGKTFAVDEQKAVDSLYARIEIEDCLKGIESEADTVTDDLQKRLDAIKAGSK